MSQVASDNGKGSKSSPIYLNSFVVNLVNTDSETLGIILLTRPVDVFFLKGTEILTSYCGAQVL